MRKDQQHDRNGWLVRGGMAVCAASLSSASALAVEDDQKAQSSPSDQSVAQAEMPQALISTEAKDITAATANQVFASCDNKRFARFKDRPCGGGCGCFAEQLFKEIIIEPSPDETP